MNKANEGSPQTNGSPILSVDEIIELYKTRPWRCDKLPHGCFIGYPCGNRHAWVIGPLAESIADWLMDAIRDHQANEKVEAPK